ncbi:type II toxin-antitoxin system RelE/ParE family toxin [Belliella marina]|uniref:Type II toxin-antitoxin system RelE/ParE family toxin n=1 Tax=Belliella marina TaxID=1644146 RepID=A0ABW4VQV2_9BACT
MKYWKNRKKSIQYSKKLDSLFWDAIKLIQLHPEVGKSTDEGNVRFKIVRDYLIFYEVKFEKILILSFWDSRRDPTKFSE